MNTYFILSCVGLIILVVAGLSLGIGSWLELNGQLSFITLTLIDKYSERISVSIGLWRYSIYDHASDIHLDSTSTYNFNADLSSILYHTLSNTAQLSNTSTTRSYIRVVPLMISTVLAAILVIHMAYIVITTYRKDSLVRITQGLLVVTSILSLINVCLISTSLGITWNRYTSNIESSCNLLNSTLNPDNDENYYLCAGYTGNNEIVLLGTAVGFFSISILYSLLLLKKSRYYLSRLFLENEETEISQPPLLHKPASDLHRVAEEKTRLAEITQQLRGENDNPVALSPPPLSSGSIRRNGSQRREMKAPSSPESDGLVSMTHQHPIITENRVYRRQETTAFRGLTPSDEKAFFSSQSSLPMDENILLPPKLPFVSRTPETSSIGRPLSHGSDNTFGAELTHSGSHHTHSNVYGDDDLYDNQRSRSSISNIMLDSNQLQSHHTLGNGIHSHSSADEDIVTNTSQESTDNRQELSKRIHDYRTVSS
ncbi:hypothetical protein BDB01DRAFT_850241 [Pilobolus umbonatus]|nr:hypothetical protein BDB01DRAFT_850241 [Pilobolus umbonatus]